MNNSLELSFDGEEKCKELTLSEISIEEIKYLEDLELIKYLEEKIKGLEK